MKTTTQPEPKTKKLVVTQGKGTPRERRVETGVDLFWSETLKKWVSIPE